jgi:hypothetical protein
MLSKRAVEFVGGHRSTPVALLVAGLLLSACGVPQPQATATPALAPTTAPGATQLAVRVLTLDDNGKTITLQVGERFQLELGEAYDWTVTVADPAIVSRVVNATAARGAQGLYEAHEMGTATLMAVGDPVCRKAQPPCAAPTIQFVIALIVQ